MLIASLHIRPGQVIDHRFSILDLKFLAHSHRFPTVIDIHYDILFLVVNSNVFS